MQEDLFRGSFVPSESKLCYSCKKELPKDDFRVLVRRHGDRHTLSSTCRFCDDKAEIIKAEFRRHNKLPEDYACPLCQKTHKDYLDTGRYWTQSPFSVDHCQETMVVRGWLCNPCNSSMGLAQHDPDLLRRMADYLEDKNDSI